jgi:hypothetical protein
LRNVRHADILSPQKLNGILKGHLHNLGMRVAGSIIVALLALHFVDEQYNKGRYSQAATMMLSHITRSFG